MNCIGGLVGEMMASSFLSYIHKKSSINISASDIVKNYKKSKTKVRVLAKENNTEQLNSLVHEVLLFIQDPENSCDDRKHKENIESFIGDLPPEFRRMMREHLETEDADAA